ncbi:MAG: hypothetical protein CMB56_005010 [Methanobacteriota archaeon]|nr:MAG: hypothetical protein CMB56_005010 [Euryarchaeota archaeon]|tara:strand:- start:4867 stop:5931 length:1065 start_codon:yes stop_codon:yes gene_type:complete
MTYQKIKASHSVELLVFLIIIFSSTIIIENSKIEDEALKFEPDNISGTITLSTRDAMNALGLDESSQTGAIAEINLTVNSVESEGCLSCNSTPNGFQIEGPVEITNIRNLIGGLGRVEGYLKITYLKEYAKANFIGKEWFVIDWNASGGKELDSYSQITFIHDPPVWETIDRYDASFLEVNNLEIKSRTGPWLLAKVLTKHDLNIQGCLPNSLNCEKSFSPDINLTKTQKISEIPKIINHDFVINKVDINKSTVNTPSKIENIRNIFELKNESENHNLWCDNYSNDLIAIKSWEIDSESSRIISPMSSWFKILGLSSISFFQTEGVWTESEYENAGCASVSDKNGKLKVNIIFR